jgi:5'(3')-deoxyribonucleotidase
MIIAIDVDDTVLDLMNKWLSLYNSEYNDNIDKNKITQWNFSQFLKPECGNKIYDYLEFPNLYNYIAPIEGALEGINKLKNMGHRVIFVTAGMHKGKYLRLKELGFLDKEEDYVEARDKSLILADVLIDDRPFNLWQFKGKYGIVFEEPWSDDEDLEYRAKDWKEVVSIIKKISKKEKNG